MTGALELEVGMSTSQEAAQPPLFLSVEVETREGQLKEGKAGSFTVMCDEGPRLGGRGSAPPPLHYFLLAAGF
jgi:hypothetical protein